MSTIWITGAHGFIGRHVARELARTGHVVRGLGHGLWPANAALQWGVRDWLNADVNGSSLGALSATGAPDAVVHLAGGSSVGAAVAQPREDFRRTVESTAELLEWLRQEAPRARLLVVSSAAVYGDGHTAPIPETAVLNPYSPYGHHKAIMESLCRSYAASFGLNVVVARLFSVYGAGLRKQLLWDLCSKLAAGAARLELGGSGAETRDWVHAEDIATALPVLLPLASPDVPLFNVASGGGVTVRDIARLLAEAWTAGGTAPALEFSGRGRAGDPRHLVADTAKIRALGWSPSRALAPSLAAYVEWFREKGVS